MNIACDITNGMTPQEKNIYFEHMEKRHREEAQKVEDEKRTRKSYKQMLIDGIVDFSSGRFDIEYLKGCGISTLERIYDNC